MKIHLMAVAAVMLLPALALSQSIEEKQKRAKAEKLTADFVKTMNKACKTTLPDKDIIDWASWPQAEDETASANGTVHSQCKYVLYGAQSLCSDAIAQETFAKDVKKFVCKGDGKDDLSFELQGDTLVAHTKFGVRDTDKKTKKWLSANLK